VSINLPDGSFLNLTESAHPLQLYPAYGGAQLKLRIGIAGNKETNNPVALTGILYAGRVVNYHQNLPELCRLTCEDLVTPHQATQAYTFTGFVTDKALAALEEARHGGALHLELRDLQARLVHGEPPRLTSAPSGSSVTVTIPAGTWAEELEKVSATAYLDVLVPITDDKEVASATAHLRTARDYLGEGKAKATPTEIRLALDKVCDAYGTKKALRAAAAKKPRDRSVYERWVMTVETAYSELSAFIHGDDEAVAGAEIDRPLAVALLAQVAGMVARLAAELRTGVLSLGPSTVPASAEVAADTGDPHSA
jgi:hypothetical protein